MLEFLQLSQVVRLWSSCNWRRVPSNSFSKTSFENFNAFIRSHRTRQSPPSGIVEKGFYVNGCIIENNEPRALNDLAIPLSTLKTLARQKYDQFCELMQATKSYKSNSGLCEWNNRLLRRRHQNTPKNNRFSYHILFREECIRWRVITNRWDKIVGHKCVLHYKTLTIDFRRALMKCPPSMVPWNGQKIGFTWAGKLFDWNYVPGVWKDRSLAINILGLLFKSWRAFQYIIIIANWLAIQEQFVSLNCFRSKHVMHAFHDY